jgi:hypothetical protein
MKALKSALLIWVFTACLLFSTAARASSLWTSLLSGLSLFDNLFTTIGYNLYGGNSVMNLAQELQVNPLVIERLLKAGYSYGQIDYMLNLHRSTGMPLQRIVDLQTLYHAPLSFLPYYITRENPRLVFFPVQTANLQFNRDYYDNDDYDKMKFKHFQDHDNGLHLGQLKEHGNSGHDNGHGDDHGNGKSHGNGHGKDKD